MARDSNSGWSRPWAAFFALVIILGGVAVSLGFGVRLRSALERNADKRVTTTSAVVQTTVTDELSRYADSVRLAAAALSALPEPTRAGFDRISAAVAAQELTAVRALTFVVPAAPDQVDEVGPYWRARGAQGLRPEAANGLQQHLFTVFARGLGKAPAPPLGVDQGQAQAEVDVTKLARAGRDAAVSDAYVRLADAALPPAQQQLSFDVVAPVYGARQAVAGFLVLNVVGSEFISSTLYRAAGDLLDAQLLTRSGTGSLAEVAAVIRQGDGGVQFRRTQNFEAGQRQWTLRTSAGYRTLLPNAGRTDLIVVVAGSALAVMFGTLMYLQMSAAKRTEEEIGLEVAERLEEFDRSAGAGRLRRSLAAQESLVSRLVDTAPAAHTTEVDLHALVEEVVAAKLATEAAARTGPADQPRDHPDQPADRPREQPRDQPEPGRGDDETELRTGSAPDPASSAETEAAPDPISGPETEPDPAGGPETEPDPTGGPNTERHAATSPDPAGGPDIGTVPDPTGRPRTELRAAPTPDPADEPETGPGPDPTGKPRTELETATVPEPDTGPGPGPDPTGQPGGSEPEAGSETGPTTGPQPGPTTGPETGSGIGPKAGSKGRFKRRPKAGPTVRPEARSGTGPEAEAGAGAGAETGRGAGPEAGPGAAGAGAGPAEIVIGELPVVRANAPLLRLLVDTMLTDALERTPPGQAPRVTVSAGPGAGPGSVRLLVDSADTEAGCTLQAAEQMAVNPS